MLDEASLDLKVPFTPQAAPSDINRTDAALAGCTVRLLLTNPVKNVKQLTQAKHGARSMRLARTGGTVLEGASVYLWLS